MPSSVLFLLLLSSPLSCISSGSSDKSDGASPDKHQEAAASPGQPAGMKANSTTITATIDSIVLVDSINYKVSVRTTAAEPEGDIASLAEKGQSMVLAPAFVLDEAGKEDRANERNMKLLSLRSAKSGETLRGRVSLTREGKWVLTELLGHE